jgi:hypothetical protein
LVGLRPVVVAVGADSGLTEEQLDKYIKGAHVCDKKKDLIPNLNSGEVRVQAKIRKETVGYRAGDFLDLSDRKYERFVCPPSVECEWGSNPGLLMLRVGCSSSQSTWVPVDRVWAVDCVRVCLPSLVYLPKAKTTSDDVGVGYVMRAPEWWKDHPTVEAEDAAEEPLTLRLGQNALWALMEIKTKFWRTSFCIQVGAEWVSDMVGGCRS